MLPTSPKQKSRALIFHKMILSVLGTVQILRHQEGGGGGLRNFGKKLTKDDAGEGGGTFKISTVSITVNKTFSQYCPRLVSSSHHWENRVLCSNSFSFGIPSREDLHRSL